MGALAYYAGDEPRSVKTLFTSPCGVAGCGELRRRAAERSKAIARRFHTET